MPEEALQTELTADPPAEGAPPAGQPAASSDATVEKTPEQLEAEKAAEAKKQEDEEAEEAAVRKKPWFQRRIDEVTKQRREAERRAQKLEEMQDSYNYKRGVELCSADTPDYSEAETSFLKEVQEHPKNGYAYYYLAVIYDKYDKENDLQKSCSIH